MPAHAYRCEKDTFERTGTVSGRDAGRAAPAIRHAARPHAADLDARRPLMQGRRCKARV